LNSARRLSALWLLVVFAPLVRADETNGPAKKPAAPATPTAAKPTAAKPTAAKPAAVQPAKPAVHEADDELLEFLGSVGEESDGEWIDYLSKTDLSKAAKARATTK
jgi:hypothetical protein